MSYCSHDKVSTHDDLSVYLSILSYPFIYYPGVKQTWNLNETTIGKTKNKNNIIPSMILGPTKPG